MWKYRPAFVRLKTVTNDHPDILVSDLVPNAFVVVDVAAGAVVVRRNTKKMLLLTYRDSNGLNDREK